MDNKRSSNTDRSAISALLVVSGEEFPCCAFLLCSADVVADVEYADGSILGSVPLQKGWNPIQACKLTFSGAVIVAHYN